MRADLIRLIHVARRELHLDDETYRAALVAAVPGKTSCRDMSLTELETVLAAFKARGFKRRLKPVNRGIKSASIPAKIRVIWQMMHRQGFIASGDAQALNAWVQRQTGKINGGIGVAQLAWLNRDTSLATAVLESLKQWHRRCMLADLPPGKVSRGYENLCAFYQAYKKREGEK